MPRPRFPRTLHPWAVAPAVLAVATIAGCTALRRPAAAPVPADPGPWLNAVPPMPVGPPRQATAFAGSKACAECHPGEAADHAGSHHAHTLMEIGPEIQAYFKSSQRLSDRALGMTYSVALPASGPTLRVERPDDHAQEELRPRWVVGSGRFGHTFLVEKDGRFMESRLSYYPPISAWGWTPGQQQQTPFRAPLGSVMDEGNTIACFVCHSTFVAREGGTVQPAGSIFNVGCERCHGPGKGHIDSVRAGRGIGPLYTYRNASGETLMKLCAECHRSPGAIPEGELATHPDLPRFAGTALAASACYKKSHGKLTCITCHSPHQVVSTDLAAYDRGCRNCHSGSGPTSPACPVNRKSGCVNCHMPAESLGEPQALKFRNHWIRTQPSGKDARTPVE